MTNCWNVIAYRCWELWQFAGTSADSSQAGPEWISSADSQGPRECDPEGEHEVERVSGWPLGTVVSNARVQNRPHIVQRRLTGDRAWPMTSHMDRGWQVRCGSWRMVTPQGYEERREFAGPSIDVRNWSVIRFEVYTDFERIIISKVPAGS